MLSKGNAGLWLRYTLPKSMLVSGLKVRVAVFLALLILCIFITMIGATSEIESEEALKLSQNLNDLREATKTVGFQVIFGNNFMHALIMFAPILGPCWGFYVLYNTGRFIAAVSALKRINPVLTFFVMFFFPFTWMEYISYALAISESLFLAYSIFKRGLKAEFASASKLIVFCAALLLVAALIEFHIISLLESS